MKKGSLLPDFPKIVETEGFACIPFSLVETGKRNKGIHQSVDWFMHMPPACADRIRIPPYNEKSGTRKSGYRIFGGDGGIRTLDLTDANRTLSQVGRKYCCNTNEKVSMITEKYERKEQIKMNLFSSVPRTE